MSNHDSALQVAVAWFKLRNIMRFGPAAPIIKAVRPHWGDRFAIPGVAKTAQILEGSK